MSSYTVTRPDRRSPPRTQSGGSAGRTSRAGHLLPGFATKTLAVTVSTKHGQVAAKRGSDVLHLADQARNSAAPPLSCGRMVGRDAERDLLVLHALAPSAVLLVGGEAGIGKSRLVREVLASPRLGHLNTLIGACQDLREPLPYAPVVDALRQLASVDGPHSVSPGTGALRTLLPELDNRLAPALDPTDDPQTERLHVFRGVVELLRTHAPALVVIEDLHWGDSGTLDLLRYLIGSIPEGVRLILTYRHAPSDGEHLDGLLARVPHGTVPCEVRLRPLGVDDVATMAAQLLDVDAVPDPLPSQLQALTAGVPFVVEEAVRAFAEQPDFFSRHPAGHPVPGAADLTVPPGVRHAWVEQVNRSPQDVRRLISAAAVLRGACAEELLVAVAGLRGGHGSTALCWALERGLLRELTAGSYGFRHELARRAAYESLAAPLRRRLHRRAVDALVRARGPVPYVQLAHHCREAGLLSSALRYTEQAADAARSAGDDAAATRLLREALVVGSLPTATTVRLAVKLGRSAVSGLEHAETVEVLRDVLAHTPMPRAARGEVRYRLGVLLRNQAGAGLDGLEEIARSIPELRNRPHLASWAMASLALATYLSGASLQEHLQWGEQARANALQLSDAHLRIHAVGGFAATLMHCGDAGALAMADGLPLQTDTPSERRDLARAWNNLAHTAISVGHHRRAELYLERSTRLLSQAEASYVTGLADSTRLLHSWATGRWRDLAQQADRTLAVLEDVPELAAEAELVLGQLSLAHGRLALAERHLKACVQACLPQGSVPGLPQASAALARLMLSEGDAAGAWHQVEPILNGVRRKGVWAWAAIVTPVAVEALTRAGGLHRARELLTEYSSGIEGLDAPATTAALLASLGVLAEAEGDFAMAGAHHRAAAAVYEAMPAPYEAARSLEGSARCALIEGDGEGGHTAAAAAAAAFATLGASWDLARVGRLQRTYGATVVHRMGRRGYGGQLSPREREVARLAADGLTNREIAAALFLSRRTVEEHIAKAVRKLGVASRHAITSRHLERHSANAPDPHASAGLPGSARQ
ncbi:helix-turn-helix transcriptional regulator [Streptomyces luteolus]|uniref:AAA family ATPase n=1 Tax=Streptomyces luteolus TaxID=3043615 RepID=A0ABT6SVA3_9ACTN|nr:LuxR family transcriptional regulator [Streptomyces sp. B-S-A12]MDI3419033.1 AAA family ATPase [Streptomyces sp. B-S-A12]